MEDMQTPEKTIEARRAKRAALRRRRIRNQRIMLGVLLLVVVLLIILIVRGCSAKDPAPADQTNTHDSTAEENVALPSAADTSKATLAAVGDIMAYDEQLADAKQADGSYDFTNCLKDVTSYLSTADLAVGNLEANFCGEPYQGYPNFTAPESLAKNLADAGMDLLQTANTYSIQNGISGLTSTIKYITEAGMTPLGTYYLEAAKKENNGVVVKDVNGVKIAFIAYTKGVNNMYLPEGAEYSVDLLYTDYYSTYSTINQDAILASIQSAKDLNPDVIVAMLHWGSEYELNPSDSQDKIADLMFQNGVDVILGSHSHLVGPMERRTVTTTDGDQKEVFIAYSLGNFMSSMTTDGTQSSVILNLEFTKDNKTGSTTISNIDYVPIYLQYDTEAAAGSQIRILDISAEIAKYDTGTAGAVSEETYNAMKSALEQLKTNTKSDFAKS